MRGLRKFGSGIGAVAVAAVLVAGPASAGTVTYMSGQFVVPAGGGEVDPVFLSGDGTSSLGVAIGDGDVSAYARGIDTDVMDAKFVFELRSDDWSRETLSVSEEGFYQLINGAEVSAQIKLSLVTGTSPGSETVFSATLEPDIVNEVDVSRSGDWNGTFSPFALGGLVGEFAGDSLFLVMDNVLTARSYNTAVSRGNILTGSALIDKKAIFVSMTPQESTVTSIPTPSALALGLPMLGLVALRRRRVA